MDNASCALITSPAQNFCGMKFEQVREQELKFLRDLGAYEKACEREATAQYQVIPVDRK